MRNCAGDLPDAGTPAGTLAVRAADLRFPGPGTVTAAGTAPGTGEEALFLRPVLSAPAFVRRDGAVLADAWLPDLARLGELEAHLGYGVIEDMVSVALAEGRLLGGLAAELRRIPGARSLSVCSGRRGDRKGTL